MLLVLSWEDAKSQTINITSLILFMISTYSIEKHYQAFFIISNLMLILYFLNHQKIGLGDILTIAICSLTLPLEACGYFIMITGTSAAIFMQLTQTKRTPLIPFISLAFVCTLLIINYLIYI